MQKNCAGCGACHPVVSPLFTPGRPPIPLGRLSQQAPGSLDNTHLLIAASCTAYACASFHQRFIKNRTVLIGCPDVEAQDYTKGLCTLIAENDIKTITLIRMNSACCSPLVLCLKSALHSSEKFIPWRIIALRSDGSIAED